MKSKLVLVLALGFMFQACKKDKENAAVPPTTHSSRSVHPFAQRYTGAFDTATAFITLTIADSMINSYLSSINASSNDTDLRSFSLNADSLRAYLSNTSIKNIKLTLAHTMNYIHAGNKNVYAGYQAGALTIIISGYDQSGNNLFYNGNVLDHAIPCPYTCVSGSAGADSF